MGAWGEGLFDNDEALDVLSEVVGEIAADEPRAKRAPELAKILGQYRREYDGALARGVPDGMIDRSVERLDGLARERDLYDASGPLAVLGALLLVGRPVVPAEKLAGWRARFEAIDAATTSERGFWDVYAANVRAAFDRIAGFAGG